MAEGKKKSLDLRVEPGTSRSCSVCKFSITQGIDHTKGECLATATKEFIWKRLVRDRYNTTCDLFEKGERSFRDNA